MKLIYSIFILLSFNSVIAQNVVIPDSTFKALLLSNTRINTNGDDEISISEAEAYTLSIYYPNKGISNPIGIEAFTNITELNLSKNNISSLDLTNNSKLVNLNCRENNMKVLNLKNISNITTIDCSRNELSEIDLSSAMNLIFLNVNENTLTELNISAATTLEEVYCATNNLISLNLTQNTLLKNITINGNDISELEISQCNDLTKLIATDNNITMLDLSQNKALTEINLSRNELSAIDLAQNIKLEKLQISHNNLEKLELTENQNLDLIIASHNLLTSIDISTLKKTKRLDLDNCMLTSLNIQNDANDIIENLNTTKNPNLFCVLADLETVSNIPPAWKIDEQSFLNILCAGQNILTIDSTSISKACTRSTHDGAFEAWVSGGTAPYYYKLGNIVSDTSKFKNVASNRYIFTVYDTNGNYATERHAITEDFIPSFNYASGVNYSLVIMSNGEYSAFNCDKDFPLTIEVKGNDKDDYNFEWSSGTTGYIDSIIIPTYTEKETVEFFNDSGRSCEININLKKRTDCPIPISIDSSFVIHSCNPYDSTGSVQIFAQGMGPLTYHYKGLSNFSGYFDNLNVGVHKFMLTDLNSDTLIESIEIKNSFNLDFSDSNVTIDSFVVNGNPGYQVLKCPEDDSTLVTLFSEYKGSESVFWSTGLMNEYEAIVAPITNTYYSVVIIDSLTTRQCDLIFQIIIDDEENCDPSANTNISIDNSQLRCYPNPNLGRLYINTNKPGLKQIEILSSLGKKMYSTETVEEEIFINLAGYTPGFYLINSTFQNVKSMQKIILLNH